MAIKDIRIAVLGGGMQGCCIALALAERGARVTLYDLNTMPLSRAAVVNEGKIHLGYVFCGDTSLATARTLSQGAMLFAPLMRRYLGTSPLYTRSTPFFYLVHRDSLKSAENISDYLVACHEVVMQAAASREGDYFGIKLRPPRSMSPANCGAAFDPHFILAAFETSEIAISPLLLADAMRVRIATDPNITLRMGRTVVAVEDENTRLRVVSDGPEGRKPEVYDHVVNALWDSRHKIDAGRNLYPSQQWLYRFKYGIRFRPPMGAPLLPSLTIVSGPFGDIVRYSDGTVYLSWYPACLLGKSMELAPPGWPTEPDAKFRAKVVTNSFSALAEIVPVLRDIDPNELPDLAVKGGVIVAWGNTDIDDRKSMLHSRYQIGVTSEKCYHSVDPGKYTMAPYFAAVCAERIVGT